MKETMYSCYRSQFGCMRRILERKDALLEKFIPFYAEKRPGRMYLLGSGTSFNACAAAAPYMEKLLGIEVTPVIPSAPGVLYGERPFVIAVSQSGRSTNTIAAIETMRRGGADVVTLTDPEDTPVAQAGSLAVLLAAGQETVGPRTRGYAATVFTLYLMALEAALATGRIGKTAFDDELGTYNESIDGGEACYDACETFYNAHLDDLKKARKYIFAGKGVAGKVALESALKVQETLCFPAIGYEYEEFLHGPACCADEELALFLFLTNDGDRERMLKTADIMDTITPNCYVITSDAGLARGNTLVLPSPSGRELPVFANILFSQLISARLTEDMGRARHPNVQNIFRDMGTKRLPG